MEIKPDTKLSDLEIFMKANGLSLEAELKSGGFSVVVYGRKAGAPEYAFKSRQGYGSDKSFPKALNKALINYQANG